MINPPLSSRYKASLAGALILLCCCLSARAVQASNWMESQVTAYNQAAAQAGQFDITIRNATVLNGHASSGSPCPELPIGKIITLASAEQWPINTLLTLRYTHKGGMTANGPFDSIRWTMDEE